MTKFHIGWQKNLALVAGDLSKVAKLNQSLLEMTKADLKSGKILDWGSYCNGTSGYILMEGTETDIVPVLKKWMPYIIFSVRPVINVDQAIEVWK